MTHDHSETTTDKRDRLHEIIFEADTRAGKLFDIALIVCILASVTVVMLDSVSSIQKSHGRLLNILEWTFTGIFTLEYVLRLYCVRRSWKYAISFYGLVDLLSVIPTYVGFLVPGAHSLSSVRILRVCRIFRVLKFSLYLGEANLLMKSLVASRRKITVFISAVISIVVILGSIMYIVEGQLEGTDFTSIPKGVYWAIVTLTTVGYGDVKPITPIGQTIASAIMILGYSIIAIPTGIVTAEMVANNKQEVSTKCCPDCSAEGHDPDAIHCKYCGAIL